MDFPIYIAAFIVAIGVLVVVHEFGHFSVARLLGVKVLRFSVGFGRPLWMRRVGKDRTEISVAAIPLGGYVKMLDETEGEVPAKERHRAFNRQRLWKRALIVLAGPMFNFAFAIFAYWMVFIAGIDGIKPVVARVLDGTPAQQAGFKPGDELVAIDDKAVVSWDQRRLYLFQRALDHAVVKVDVRDANGVLQTRTLDLSGFPANAVNAGLIEQGIGISPVPTLPVTVGKVEEGPAKRAGLQVEDEIIRIDGKAVDSAESVISLIRQSPGKALRLDVKRGAVEKSFEIVPEPKIEQGKTVGYILAGLGGPSLPPSARVKVRLPIGTALAESVVDTWRMSWLTLEMLYRMLRLEVSAKSISGPLTIAQYAGASAKIGLVPFLLFLAVISISLGVLNLLPIPVLDGGHLLYYVIEAVKGGPLPERFLLAGQRIGIVLLAMLMTLALYNDITRIFH
jgi:regulator of sigma E protease